MSERPDLIPVSDAQLQLDLSVLLAVNSRRIPMLHGKGEVQGTTERDQARHDFVSWMVAALKNHGYRFFPKAEHECAAQHLVSRARKKRPHRRPGQVKRASGRKRVIGALYPLILA